MHGKEAFVYEGGGGVVLTIYENQTNYFLFYSFLTCLSNILHLILYNQTFPSYLPMELLEKKRLPHKRKTTPYFQY